MGANEAWVWVDFAGTQDALELLQAELEECGSCGAEERNGGGRGSVLRVYWPAELGLDNVLGTAHTLAAACRTALVGHGFQGKEDWLAQWKRYFRPVRVSSHVWVCPPWDVPTLPAEERLVVIEPGMAFGTGHHPTTRLCLNFIEEKLHPGDSLLDVGCGSAVLAIAAAKLGASSVVAIDNDPESIDVAAANVQRNGVADRVRLVCANFVACGETVATHVVSNVITAGLLPLLPPLARSLRGGWAILSGVGVEHRDEAVAAATAAGLQLVEERQDEGWCAFACRRRDG